jgi:uncharacterized membrane protein HdeD (DUF308 family)
MIILSVFIFNNPAAVLAGISLWFGLIVLLVGMVGVIGWFAGSKEDREPARSSGVLSLHYSGLVMLTNIFASHESSLPSSLEFGCLLPAIIFSLQAGQEEEMD